jgi:hypothetical protein
MAQIGPVIKCSEPEVRVHTRRQSGQGGQGGKGDTRGYVATGAALMRALLVVMLQKGLGHLLYLLKCSWPIALQALLTVCSVIPFDKRIFVRPMGGQTLGSMPKHNKRRRSGEGKSRPAVPPTRALDHGRRSSDMAAHTSAGRGAPLPSPFVHENLPGPEPTTRLRCRHPQNCRPPPPGFRFPWELCSGETVSTSLKSI